MYKSEEKNKIILNIVKTIKSEATTLNNLANNIDYNEIFKALDLITNANKVVISGIGKSGIVANKIASCFNSIGVQSVYLNPQEALHGDIGIVNNNDVAILISKSGTTKELLNIIPLLKERNIKIISILCTKNTHIEKYSDVTLLSFVEKEAGELNLVPTSSVIVSLAIGDALTSALINIKSFKHDDFLNNHPHGQLGKNLKMTIENLMITDNLPLITMDMTLREVLLTISNGKLGCAIVINKNDSTVDGLITDGDLRKFWQKNDVDVIDLNNKLSYYEYSEIVNKNPIMSKNKKLKIYEILESINKFNLRILPVVENNKLIGILDVSTIIK